MRWLAFAPMLVLVTGCAGEVSNGDGGNGTAKSGLQYDGSIARPRDGAQNELSAPLFPDATVFQQFQDASVYGSLSSAQRTALVDDDVRTFEQLLNDCAASYPAIKLEGEGGAPLTAAEIATNYAEVARCGYEVYGAKPYWVPSHVADVDICGRKLGDGWRLPTEADVAGWQESDFEFFKDTLTIPGSDEHWYYSLEVYLRATDGTIKLANLAPQTEHVSSLPVSGSDLDALYIGGERKIVVRCVRISEL